MKKTMFIIVAFAVFLISVSAYSGKVFEASEGYVAPYFAVEKGDTVVSIDDMKGKYLLLTFWASSDAKSRLACRTYTFFARNNESEEQFCHMAINFDKSQKLFAEIVRRDKLNAKSQFYVGGSDASKIVEDYYLENGFNSYLVNPQGRIIAKNPSTQFLTQILSN